MLSVEQLRAIMPNLSPGRALSVLPFLKAAIAEFAVEAPARTAAFLAQLAHESGQLRFMEEIWGPTAAQTRYEPQSSLATSLGNTTAGDGKRFKGRGPIQITGRANYRRYGDLLGIDLVSDPERAALPQVAFRVAGLYWMKNGLNELADRATADAFRLITRRINGGLNGLADRERFYAVARTVLGVSEGRLERGRTLPLPSPEPAFERGLEAVRAFKTREDATTRPATEETRPERKAAKKPGPKAKGAKNRSKRPASRRLKRKTTVRSSVRSRTTKNTRTGKQSTSRGRSLAKSKR
jgi:putative chitinase